MKKRKPTTPIFYSEFAREGFIHFAEWDYLVKRGVHRRVYIKRLKNDITVKAYKHERGFTVGVLERQDRPLCKKHVDCANIEDVKQTIGSWEAMT